MKRKWKWKQMLAVFFGSLVLMAGIGPSVGAASPQSTGMVFENGMAQPILTWSNWRTEDYTNEGSDILRFCVYVETDYDTDRDGMADLVKVFVQVPRAAAEGAYQAASIYDPTPYDAGEIFDYDEEELYEKTPFDYQSLYQEGEKRTPASLKTTLEAAKEADPKEFNYTAPDGLTESYYDAVHYDYYLIRGFAVVMACGIGTLGSEGFELCGMDLERDSHKCVVEWLAGNRKAYTDKTQNIEIRADWSNGNVAMTGCSYGGTMVYEAATTGVEGLKTVIPYAGIASWYDYTNSQGAPIRFDVNYTSFLAASNCGGVYLDDEFTQLKNGYGSYLWQVARDEDSSNGDYTYIWEIKDYSDDYENINCSALIVQGLNDFNVTTRQADLMMRTFEKAGRPVKLVLHQEGHGTLEGRRVNGEIWDETVNKWLSHYLYNVDNGIEKMAEVTVQSNLDGSWKTYDKWNDFSYLDAAAECVDHTAEKKISSAEIAEKGTESFTADSDGTNTVAGENFYYLSLDGDSGAVYMLDLPENTTIFGVPEIHVRLSTEDVDKDGMMITAVLVDFIDEKTQFPAYVSTPELGGNIPVTSEEEYEIGEGIEDYFLIQPEQLQTTAKAVTYAWTELNNPGCGYDSKDYVLQEDGLEAGTFYDYTFYMLPTVYTLAPGHQMALVLTTWDPYRAFLDEEYNLNPNRDARYSFFTYGYTIDNTSLKARIPVK